MKMQSGTCRLGYVEDPHHAPNTHRPDPNINERWTLGFPTGVENPTPPGPRQYGVRVDYPFPNRFTQQPMVGAVIYGIDAAIGDSGELQVTLAAQPGAPPPNNDPKKVFSLLAGTDGDDRIFRLFIGWIAFSGEG
jgi:hypothetical protein